MLKCAAPAEWDCDGERESNTVNLPQVVQYKLYIDSYSFAHTVAV